MYVINVKENVTIIPPGASVCQVFSAGETNCGAGNKFSLGLRTCINAEMTWNSLQIFDIHFKQGWNGEGKVK